jgi:hypothetical protein
MNKICYFRFLELSLRKLNGIILRNDPSAMPGIANEVQNSGYFWFAGKQGQC